jgi:hypothetical protein
MNCKTVMLAVALTLMPLAAQADIADLFRQYDGSVADKNFIKTLITGIADGFGAANDQLKEAGKPMLYCAPDTFKFTGDQLIDILRRWVQANRAKAPRIDTAPPAMALARRENRAMDLVRYHAKIRNVPSGRMMDYFISKAEEILKTYEF